jgi:putative tryptophan/tyrosine transport system substrate-binding protein
MTLRFASRACVISDLPPLGYGKSNIAGQMKRRRFPASSLASAWLPRGLAAQGAAKLYRIGWVRAQRAPSLAPYLEAFRSGLAALGYVEGRNLVIEYRYADDAIERVPELAAELARVPVDLLVAQAPPPSRSTN